MSKAKFIICASFFILPALAFIQQVQTGKASFYADKFNGRKTASGELYHPDSLTAAHKTMPFDTFVKVTNLENNQSVIVRINDRGPFISGRIIDLSKSAMVKLSGLHKGVINVKIEKIKLE